MGIQKNRRTTDDGETHMHIDIIYAAIPNDTSDFKLNKEESDDIRWFSREDLEYIDCIPLIVPGSPYPSESHPAACLRCCS